MRCSFSSPSFWYNLISVSFGHTLFSEPCRLFSLSGSLIWPSCLLSVTSDLHLDCRVWQSYFLLFKSVFLTKQRILQSSPSVVPDGLPAFGVIELVGGLIFFKNLTTHKFLLSVWWCLFWFCQPPDGLLASPSLWVSYMLGPVNCYQLQVQHLDSTANVLSG